MAKKTPATKKPAATEEARIEYVAIDEIRRWPRNPKAHALDHIGASFTRFGYVDPVLLDEKSGMLVGGHGRLDKLALIRDAGEPAPKRVVVKDGRWFVPVIRGLSFENEAEAEAYLVTTNRLVEAGGWDQRGLAEIMKDQVNAHGLEGLSGMGYSEEEYQKLLKFLPQAPEDVTFKAFDESSANVVKMATCPKCKNQFPL